MTTASLTVPRSSGAGTFSLRSWIAKYYFVPALVISIVLLAINLWLQPNFNWGQQLLIFAPFAIVAMASSFAPMSGGGGIDLSISPVMTLTSAVYVVWLAPNGLGGLIAIPIVLVTGVLVGLVNGLIVTRLRISPIIGTLCMNFIIIGVCLKVAPQATVITTGWMRDLAVNGLFGIPAGLVLIAIPVIIWSALRLTPFTRTLLWVGSNDIAAFASGVNVGLVRVIAYSLGGLVAGIGGITLVTLSGTVDASTAAAYLVPGLVAMALGGVAVEGGRGGMAGPIFGAAIIYLLQGALTEAGFEQAWLQVVYGLLLVGAIIFSKKLSVAGKRAS
ncbi:ABC transporter permease [Leifsonia kafniensis]|uniref:Autoinducer 2 import system permease protein LsrD n=1 Tax=Leifsonia kafniensis TaxID=475957 RepID=A0ABP7KSV7_9MICO